MRQLGLAGAGASGLAMGLCGKRDEAADLPAGFALLWGLGVVWVSTGEPALACV